MVLAAAWVAYASPQRARVLGNLFRCNVVITRKFSKSTPASHNEQGDLNLAFPTYYVWGANTNVGKTLVSVGLAAAAARKQVGAINIPWRKSRA